MIDKFDRIPVTEQSHPFCSAVQRCALTARGYAEEEYLFTGTANVYGTGSDGKPRKEQENCPYTNRMILRRPADMTRFSGSVIVEIINSTANFDIERVWINTWRYLTRHGHIYVGITSKPNVFPALKTFDPERYGALTWPNPAFGSREMPEAMEKVALLGPEDQEMGLIWDMLLDLPEFLRSSSDENPLKKAPIHNIYLSGWSQSCSYINRLVNSFVYPERKEAPKVYDGYFATGGVHMLGTPLNRYECNLPLDALQKRIDFCPVPLIEVQTESENSDFGGFGGYSARRADSNVPGFLYRYMEITGASHDSAHTARDYGRFDDDVGRATGTDGAIFRRLTELNDYPEWFGFHAALHKLLLWAEQGIAPAGIPRIVQTAQGENVRDAFGNSLGGLRTPLLELPVARYLSWTEFPASEGKNINYLMGHRERFSAALLRELYTDVAQYRTRVRRAIAREVACGMILSEDAEELEEYCVSVAVQAGL